MKNAELGYIYKDEQQNTKLFPKTLGRGVQYSIEEGFDRGLKNPVGTTLEEMMAQVLDGKDNTDTVKEMLDLLLHSVYGQQQGGGGSTPSPTVTTTNSILYVEGDSTYNNQIQTTYLESQYNTSDKTSITFSNATNIQCWYNSKKTESVVGNGNKFEIDFSKFKLGNYVSFGDAKPNSGEYEITKSLTIYYSCKVDGQDVNGSKNVSLTIKFVAPTILSATATLQQSTPIGLKTNLNTLQLSVNLTDSCQTNSISSITSIKYGFSLGNLTTVSNSTKTLNFNVSDFINDNLDASSKIEKTNDIYYIILNDSLTSYQIPVQDLKPLYIVYTKTPSSRIDVNCLVGDVVSENMVTTTIKLKPTVIINGTISDFYYAITEYVDTYPKTPLFYSGQSPEQQLVLSELQQEDTNTQYDGSWRTKQFTSEPYVLECNPSNVKIDYGMLGGGSNQEDGYVYYGLLENDDLTDDDFDNGYAIDIDVIENGKKLSVSETLFIEERKYYCVWIAMPNGVSKKEFLKNGDPEELEGTFGMPFNVGEYTVYCKIRDVQYPEMSISFEGGNATQSTTTKHPSNRLVSVLFRKDIFGYIPDIWTRTDETLQFVRIEKSDFIVREQPIQMKYDDNTISSQFYWGYLKSPQNEYFQMKLT